MTPFGPGEPGGYQITNGFKVPFLALEVISICGPVTLRNIRTPQQILLPTKVTAGQLAACVQYSLVPRHMAQEQGYV